MTRVYTVAEIDAMREALQRRYPQPEFYQSGNLPNHDPVNITYGQQHTELCRVRKEAIENELRTYILAGVNPKELT